MSWLSKVVRPKLRELVGGPRDIPDQLWRKCSNCEQLLFVDDLHANLNVCPHCGKHHRMGNTERFASLFDSGDYELIPLPRVSADPLKFRDVRKYSDRLKDAQGKTGQGEALAVARGKIGAVATVVAGLDFAFLGGSMGMGVGEGLIAAATSAAEHQEALVIIAASGGARMQEGILSLMQMARTTIAVAQVREQGLPIVVILADPTTGGVSASFAMLGDITIAEPGAVIGFAGARVIVQTIRESLPEGFQLSEYLYEHGMIDLVVARPKLRGTLANVLDLLANRCKDKSGVAC